MPLLRYNVQTQTLAATPVVSIAASTGFLEPSDIAFDSSNRLYLVKHNAGEIFRYDAATGGYAPATGKPGATFVAPVPSAPGRAVRWRWGLTAWQKCACSPRSEP